MRVVARSLSNTVKSQQRYVMSQWNWKLLRESINDRDRVNLNQVARGHRRYPDHYVGWLVIPE